MRTGLFLCLFPFVAWSASTSQAAPAANDDITAMLNPIMAEKKSHDRLTKLSDIGGKLTLAEIPSALAAAKNLKQWREQAVLRQTVIRRWADLAPAEAFTYLAKLPESRLKDELIQYVASKYATQDPAAAVAAVTKLAYGSSRSDAISTVAETWAKTDAKKSPRLGRCLAGWSGP